MKTRIFRFICVCLFASLAVGCAATKEGMTVNKSVSPSTPGQVTKKFHVVNVKGNMFVDAVTLRNSINDSLRVAGVYSTAEDSVSIDVDLWKLDPSIDLGAGMLFYSEWTAEINYKLYQRNTVLRNVSVTNKDRVTLAEVPIGALRDRKATEKSIRGNVEKFLIEILK